MRWVLNFIEMRKAIQAYELHNKQRRWKKHGISPCYLFISRVAGYECYLVQDNHLLDLSKYGWTYSLSMKLFISS